MSALAALGSAVPASAKDPVVWAQERLARARASLDVFSRQPSAGVDTQRLEQLKVDLVAAEHMARYVESQIRRSGAQYGFAEWPRSEIVRDLLIPSNLFGCLRITWIPYRDEHDVNGYYMKVVDVTSPDARVKNYAEVQLILHQASEHAQHAFLLGGSLGRISPPRFEIGDVGRSDDADRKYIFTRDHILVRVSAYGEIKADRLAMMVDRAIKAAPEAADAKHPVASFLPSAIGETPTKK